MIAKLVYSKKKIFLIIALCLDLAYFYFFIDFYDKNLGNFSVELLLNYDLLLRDSPIQTVFHHTYFLANLQSQILIFLSSCQLLKLEFLNLLVPFINNFYIVNNLVEVYKT